MSEFIIIQVGQCGNQIGSALWPRILQEYNISKDNTTKKSNPASFSSFFNTIPSKKSEITHLNELDNGNIKARAILVDMEDSVVSRFKSKSTQCLFDKKCFITNYPGSGNNFAEGFYEHGPKFKEKILKTLQYSIELCDSLHGFILMFSTGGGTGSGLGSYILQILSDYYPEIERFVCPIYPTGTEDVITCPYNMTFSTRVLLESATCVFPSENRALLDIVSRQKNINMSVNNSKSVFSMFTPFEDLNSVVVDMILHLTSGSRFPGSLNFDMNDISTNMIPFPKLNFLCTGFNHSTDNISKKYKNNTNKQLRDEYFLASINRNNQLLKLDPLGPKSVLLSSTMIGRGEYCLSDMRGYTEKLQSKAKFPRWSQKVIKSGLCDVPPYNGNLAMFSMFNTSGIKDFFSNIRGHFVKLYRKKAHVHHYLKMSGFDSNLFNESLESLNDIINSYGDIENMEENKMARLAPMENY